MRIIPAIDLKGGSCVRLFQGDFAKQTEYSKDPLRIAERFAKLAVKDLHIVDLDAALGSGDNIDLIPSVLSVARDGQVGGGIRDDARAASLIEAGADRIVVGTRGLDDPEWLGSLAARWPRHVVLALDFRDGIVLRKGWTESTSRRVEDYLLDVADLPLAGILATDVGREGRLGGIDLEGCRSIVAASDFPVWISGGITSIDDLARLEDAGAAGAVLGMTLYTDTVNADEVARRWGSMGASPAQDETDG